MNRVSKIKTVDRSIAKFSEWITNDVSGQKFCDRIAYSDTGSFDGFGRASGTSFTDAQINAIAVSFFSPLIDVLGEVELDGG